MYGVKRIEFDELGTLKAIEFYDGVPPQAIDDALLAFKIQFVPNVQKAHLQEAINEHLDGLLAHMEAHSREQIG